MERTRLRTTTGTTRTDQSYAANRARMLRRLASLNTTSETKLPNNGQPKPEQVGAEQQGSSS